MSDHVMNVEGNGTLTASRGRLTIHAEGGLVCICLPDRYGIPGPKVDLTTSDATTFMQILATAITEAHGQNLGGHDD